MKKIGFYLFLIFEKLISVLPFYFLFLISDFIYFLLNYVVKYRKSVILQNLKNSFPDKTEKEIFILRKKYLKIMADLIVESLKYYRLTDKEFLKRFEIHNIEILDELYNQKKSVFLACGHTGSWELSAMLMPLITKYKTIGVYQTQTNSYFDTYIKKVRSSFGLTLVPSQQLYRYLIENKNELILNYILADQSPSKDGDNYWTSFLNQQTAFFTGLEKMSKSLDYAVVFLSIIRKGRGRYLLDFELLTDKSKETANGEISEMYVRSLERLICRYPENWLWSHRRWKHKEIIR